LQRRSGLRRWIVAALLYVVLLATVGLLGYAIGSTPRTTSCS
jgi:hypothetical protein